MAKRKLRILKKEREKETLLDLLHEKVKKSEEKGKDKLVQWGMLKELEKTAKKHKWEQDPILMAIKERMDEAKTLEEKSYWKEIMDVVSQNPDKYPGGLEAWRAKQDELLKKIEKVRKRNSEND